MDGLLTGAFGRVGTALIDRLASEDQYRFTYLDRKFHSEYDAVVAAVAYDSHSRSFCSHIRVPSSLRPV